MRVLIPDEHPWSVTPGQELFILIMVILAGPDWNPSATTTTADLIDHVIAVYEKHLDLDLPARPY